jgi:glycosyltransferase involved in cell wall biosynthesis
MKVLHINSYYSGRSFYKNLYDKQVEKGLDIDVFVPAASSTLNISNLNLGDYTKISVNHGKYDRFIFHLKHKKIYKDIVNKIDVENYSIMHAHSLFSNGYIAMKLQQKYGIPYIVAVRNTDVNTFFKYMVHLRKLGIEILKRAEKIIFLSKPYRDFVIEKYIPNNLRKEIVEKTLIIPNGIDDYWFQNRGNVKNITNGKKLKLLYVGVINKNKNVTSIIKAIEYLFQKEYEITFTIVGKVEDESIYEEIKNLSYVNYIPPIPKDKLINIYREHDIYVMVSKHESFGLVYAEAMSQGLPVIYSRGQGFDGQFAQGVVGYSVQSNSSEEIELRIIEIVNRYEFISENCLRFSDKFMWEVIEDKYMNIYKEVCNK